MTVETKTTSQKEHLSYLAKLYPFFRKSLQISGGILVANIFIVIIYAINHQVVFMRFYVDLTILEGAILFCVSPLFLSHDLSLSMKEEQNSHKKRKGKHAELHKQLDELQKSSKMTIRTLDEDKQKKETENNSFEDARKSEIYGKIGFLSAIVLLIMATILDISFFAFMP